MSSSHPRPRPRHLLDPDDIRGSHQRSIGTPQELTSVQRWVVSVMAVTTVLHFSAGVVLAAMVVDEDRLDARIGLNVLAALTAVVAVAVGRLIHRKPVASGWLALGVVPGIVGAALTFGWL
jgi:hypothetical protein